MPLDFTASLPPPRSWDSLGYATIDPIQCRLERRAQWHGRVPIMMVMMVRYAPFGDGCLCAQPTITLLGGLARCYLLLPLGIDLVLDRLTRHIHLQEIASILLERYSAMSLTCSEARTILMRHQMNILPVDRVLIIYGALADRSETKGARERLFQHLMKMHIEGEKDEHRLTMEGLSYLHNLNREIDSRN
jgi:hypothetical protein